MDVKFLDKNNVTVCYVKGEISIGTVASLKEKFKGVLSSKPQKVVFNFEKVEYIDSLGLATIIGFAKEMEKYGGVIVFCDVTSKIDSIFRITKIDKAFKMFKTEGQALRDN